MTDDEVRGNFIEWANGFLTVPVIEAYLNEDRPALPYIMVNMPIVREVRDQVADKLYEELDTENSEGVKNIEVQPKIEVEWMMSVHAYGASPTDLLRPITIRSKSLQAMEPLYPDLVIHEISEIRYVPEMVKTEWEPRAQMDVFIRGYTQDGFIVDTIDQPSFDFTRE